MDLTADDKAVLKEFDKRQVNPGMHDIVAVTILKFFISSKMIKADENT